MNKSEQLQSLIGLYRQETGKSGVDMDDVASWAMKRGVVAPTPKTPHELLSKQFSDAARIEHQKDPETGYSYRVNHAIVNRSANGKQGTLWFDIHNAKRHEMHISLTNRRQMMIGDGVQLTIDQTVWNNLNPEEQPIQMVLDFTEDVEERLQSYNDDNGEVA
jgi:hypothetical protein